VPERAADGRVYPFVTSLQWSRRFIGLKLFMLLAEHGQPGLAARLEHQAAMGDALRQRLLHAGFTVLNETPLPVVCLTHRAIAGDLAAHDRICARLGERQIAWISRTLLGRHTPALRACITHFQTDTSDLDALVDGIREACLERA
jgi:aromatic-L-amino-acid/L-tryptophan decarboxylase